MKEQQHSYREIMKATSLFGGVQVINIMISIVRSKFVAVLLGPTGMGIVGLLNSTIGLVSNLTNFGLGTSAVKDIATANKSDDSHRISTIVVVFRRLVWITGFFGAITTIFLSSHLSQLTFGNKDYTTAFIWLSVTLLFNQLASGHFVLLQGLRKLKYLANANLSGSLLGLIISVPIYYQWGVAGIVPTIIITSIISFLMAWIFGNKIKIIKTPVNTQNTYSEGKGMLKMGFMISLSGLITSAVAYLIRIFISNTGDIDDVGLFSAGFAIVGTYTGLVFNAMGTDYYPRLSAVASNNEKSKALINQQAEIAILILAPILTIFLVFINWVVILLYSTQFTPINAMIHWAALGMYFKAASWSVAFIFLAKGESKLFFLSELITNIYMLGFNIIGYVVGGLEGLGISFLVTYVLYLIQVYIIAKIKFEFNFSPAFIKIMLIQFTLGFGCFLTVKLFSTPTAYFIGSLIILITTFNSLKELNKKMDLRSLLGLFKKK